MPQAASLAETLEKTFQIKSKLIRSGGGVFEVFLNKNKIYSKKQTGRFPSDSEIVQLIKSKG